MKGIKPREGIRVNSQIKLLMTDAIEMINKADNIYIISHIQPDGDNIGSTLALAMAVKKIKNNVRVLKVDEIPKDYRFLPGIDMIRYYDIEDSIDLVIALDTSDLDRLGAGKRFASIAKKLINIDHHISNEAFGDVNIVSPTSAATGEIIFEFIKNMNIEIDKDIATCLYTAISADTGSFMYSNTSYRTHLIAAELLKLGIDADCINVNLYQNKNINRVKIFIESLNNLEFYLDNRIGIVVVSQEMLKNNSAKIEDLEGIISFIRAIDTVEVACLIKEMDKKEAKVSLRSKHYIDVASICSKFNGGGHIRAAGCTIFESVYLTKKIILKEISSNFR